ncbi:MAG TPA: serine--tRNA ligase [Actinomycetota bacterium]|jgi:seryl-tRNA synthetase|nr:serine--tRNA ligase [Actinomycetota bacterium]
MLDIKALREDPERFRAALARRNLAGAVDEILAADERRRSLTAKVEDLRAEQNKASKTIGRAEGEEKQRLIDDVARVSAELKELEPQLGEADEALSALLAATPNLPHDSAPDGFTDEDAVEVRRHLEPPEFAFEPKDHAELGAALGVLDVERAVRASGSRFVYVQGDLVFVQFALMRHAVDILVGKGFVPVIPPVLVREEVMYASGFLPTDEANIYRTDADQLYLVGTSEVSLAALHMGEILEQAALPLRYAGYSTCFRREAGTYGKDLGGMFRVHQFDKVEMFSFCDPGSSWDELEFLVSVEEEIVGNLDLPYRVVNIAAGDLGGAAAKKYDIEAWLPGQQRYREITSCSNYTDYGARRAQTRMRTDDGRTAVPHTLNGTATAIGRTLIALLENHQQEDGSVVLPEKLHPYLPEGVRVLRLPAG